MFARQDALCALTKLHNLRVTSVTREGLDLVLAFQGCSQPAIKATAVAVVTEAIEGGGLLQLLQGRGIEPWSKVLRVAVHIPISQRSPDVMDSFESVLLAIAYALPPGAQIHASSANFGASLHSLVRPLCQVFIEFCY